MHRSPASLVVAGTVALTLVVGACTPNGVLGEEPAATPSTSLRASPSVSADPSLQPSPVSTPVFTAEDEVLSVAIAEPSGLDPMRIADPGSVLVARQLYEGLTAWDPVTEEVVPAAAESWTVAKNGSVFRFKLRPGMTFHDGSRVTAQDFKFAFDRIARKKSASDLAYTLERVKGFVAANQLGRTTSLKGIKAPRDDLLVVELAQPFRELPAVLTHPGLVPLPRRAVARYDRFLTKPVGNGPFQMSGRWTGGALALTAFAGFFETPELDGIRFDTYPDAAASWPPFLQGSLDVAEVPAGQIDVARDSFGASGSKPLLAGSYYGLNVRSKQLKKRSFRKGISRAIDRDQIAERVYKGTLRAPRGIVPAGMPGFGKDVCDELCDHSPKAAERLVSDVRRRDRKVTISFTEGSPHPRIARLVRDDLEDIGVDVKLKPYSFPRFLRLLRDGDQSMYRLGWIAEYPVADVFLGSLFDSSSPDNHSGFASRKVDRLLERARAARSGTRRLRLYRRAEKKILHQAPVAPLGSFVMHWAAREPVEGIHFDVMGGFDAVDVSLDD